MTKKTQKPSKPAKPVKPAAKTYILYGADEYAKACRPLTRSTGYG
jgi:hypothetical protein